jgi:polysaccharide pyruvyl transferase WcaK-like protein
MAMNIVLLNTHSTLNSGDAAIVLSQVRFLRKFYAAPEITLTSRTPEIDRRFYKPLGLRVLPPLTPAPSVDAGLARKIGRSSRSLLDWKDKRALWEALRGADLVISSGGGYFYSSRRYFPGPMFLQNYAHIRAARLLGRPLVFFPQSFGPLFSPAAARLLKSALSGGNVVKILARERASFDALARLLAGTGGRDKIGLCPDMALDPEGYRAFSADSPVDLSALPRPVVAMTLRQWDFPEDRGCGEAKGRRAAYLRAMADACRHVALAMGGTIVIFPQSRGPGVFEDDRIISGLFRERLAGDIPEGRLILAALPDSAAPASILGLLSQADLVIATRFHSALFGLIAGIPVISIGYQPKAGGIMNWLKLGRYHLEINRLRAEEILGLAREILDDAAGVRHLIRTNVSVLQGELRATLRTALEACPTGNAHESSAGQ